MNTVHSSPNIQHYTNSDRYLIWTYSRFDRELFGWLYTQQLTTLFKNLSNLLYNKD